MSGWIGSDHSLTQLVISKTSISAATYALLLTARLLNQEKNTQAHDKEAELSPHYNGSFVNESSAVEQLHRFETLASKYRLHV